MKNKLGYDESLDCFGIHGVGSGLGVLLLVFFIRDSWMADVAQAAGGSWTAIDQLGIQLMGMAVTIVLAASVTYILCVVIEKILGFRIDEEGELQGLGYSLHREHGYGLVNDRR